LIGFQFINAGLTTYYDLKGAYLEARLSSVITEMFSKIKSDFETPSPIDIDPIRYTFMIKNSMRMLFFGNPLPKLTVCNDRELI